MPWRRASSSAARLNRIEGTSLRNQAINSSYGRAMAHPQYRSGGDASVTEKCHNCRLIMSVTDDPKTLGRTRLSFASEADIDEFVDTLEKFERGDLTPDQWRVFRLVRGSYGQRQPGDVQMLRVKVPQGILTVAQLEALA